MAIALVQQATQDGGTAASFTVSLTGVGAGNFLLLAIRIKATGTTDPVTSVTDNLGGTWTNKNSALATSNNQKIDIWVSENRPAGNTTVTINVTTTFTTQASLSEWSGIATSASFDNSGALATGSSTTPSTNADSTTNANDLIIAVVAAQGANNTATLPTNSFIALNSVSVADGVLAPSYRIVTATGAYSTAWTLSATAVWSTTIASFKAAAAVAPTFPIGTLATMGVGL